MRKVVLRKISNFVDNMKDRRLNRNRRKMVLGAFLGEDLEVFAHRGSKGNRPENTLAAFKEAILSGAEGIELDVHLSKDGQLVVIHDEKIDRTTNGSGYVRNMTLKEIQSYDAGSWFNPSFKGEKIPTFEEVLELLEELDFDGILNVEFKTNKYHYPNIEEKVSKLILSKRRDYSHIYCSFSIASLKTIRSFEPTVETCFLVRKTSKFLRRAIQDDDITSIHGRIDWAYNNIKLIDKLRKPVRLWTINNEIDMKFCLHHEIEGVITDYPRRAVEIRNSYKKE